MIRLSGLTLRRGTQVLLENADALVHRGEKVGLVGRNGAGKSSLFALLSGSLHEDTGECTLPAGWRVAQVAQQMADTGDCIADYVLAGDDRLLSLQAGLAEAERAGDGMAIARVHTELQDAGAHDARARAEAMVLGLGFARDELAQPVNRFSGGWRMRLQLARALMAPSDLLLLDEPTNHLDLDALVWLEGWLARYPGTLIVISHDREFLDATTQVTLHIEGRRLHRYAGGYSAFERQRAEQLRLQQATFQRQQERVAQLQRFIDRFKAKASKARQAQSRVKMLERMERVAPVLAEAELQFEFADPERLPNPMLVLDEAVLGYGADGTNSAEQEHVILQSVTRTVLARQRIGILGANGQGKSTFIKTVAGLLPLLGGRLTAGKGLRTGYFAQRELDVLQAGQTPLQHMQALARELGRDTAEDAREQALRNFLGGFGFPGDMVHREVGNFSGGEQARLALAMIVWQRPNLLLLDEPTNHLDLSTREALALALGNFDGTLMLVSHDRALLRAVCDELWLVTEGRIEDFRGDMDDYRRHLAEQARQRTASPTPQADQWKSAARTDAPAPRNPAELRREAALRRQALAQKTAPLRQALARNERRMQAATAEQAALQEELLQSLPADEIAEAGRRLKRLGEELEQLEERWLALSSDIESLEQALA